MRPYAKRNLQNNEQRIFNYCLSRARRVVENAFGILVAKWRILQQPLEKIVQALTCLHNYIISTNLCNNQYLHDGIADRKGPNGTIITGSWRNNIAENSFMNDLGRIGANVGTVAAMKQRETLTQYFVSKEGSVPWRWQNI